MKEVIDGLKKELQALETGETKERNLIASAEAELARIKPRMEQLRQAIAKLESPDPRSPDERHG